MFNYNPAFKSYDDVEVKLNLLNELAKGKEPAEPLKPPPPVKEPAKQGIFKSLMGKAEGKIKKAFTISSPSDFSSISDVSSVSDIPFIGRPLNIDTQKIQKVFLEINRDLSKAKAEIHALKNDPNVNPETKRQLEEKIDGLEKKLKDTMKNLYALFNQGSRAHIEDRKQLREFLEETHDQVKNQLENAKHLVIIPLRDLPREVLKQPIKRPSLEQAKAIFEQNLIAKNMGHLVGDAFLRDMMDHSGQKLEGNQTAVSLAFLGGALDYIVEKNPTEFQRVRHEIDLAKVKFNNAIALSQEIGASGTSDLTSVSQKINRELDKLSDGETFLLPSGWTDSNRSGHAMLLEFTKIGTDFLVRVINTGEGTQYHAPGSDAKHINTVAEYRIGSQELKDNRIVQRIVESKVIYLSEEFAKSNQEPDANQLYKILEEYRLPASESSAAISLLMKSQLSGTCSLRCLMAYLSMKIGKEDYKKFKNLFEKEAINLLMQPNSPLKDNPTLQIFVSRAIPNLFRHLEKEIEALPIVSRERMDLINELSGYKRRYQELFPNSASERPVPKVNPGTVDDFSQKLRKDILNAPKILTDHPPILQPTQPLELPSIDMRGASLARVMRQIQDVNAYCNNYQKDHPNVNILREKLLTEIGRLFTSDQPNPLLAELKQNPQAAESFLKALINISNQFVAPLENGIPITSQVASMFALAVGYQVATILDDAAGLKGQQRISYYGLYFPELDALKAGSGFPSVLHPTVENDLALLTKFLNTVSEKKECETPLFDPRSFGITHQGEKEDKEGSKVAFNKNASKESGDFIYTQANLNLDPNSQLEAQKAYMERKNKKFDCQLPIWMASWAYANDKLPPQYLLLRNLRNNVVQGSPYFYGSEKHFQTGKTASGSEMGMMEEDVPYFRSKVLTHVFHPLHFSRDGITHKYTDYGIANKLESKPQNTVAVESGPEVRDEDSLLSIKTELQIPMLIDLYSNDFAALANPKSQARMMSVLFQPTILAQIPPFMYERLLQFLDKAMDYFKDDQLVNIKGDDKNRALALLLNTKMRVLIFAQHTGQQMAGHISDMRSIINGYLIDKSFQTDAMQQMLLASYIESFTDQVSFSQDESKALILSICKYYKTSSIEGNLLFTSDIKANIQTLTTKLAPYLKSVSLDPAFIENIAKVYQLKPELFSQWKFAPFPLLTALSNNNQKLEVNALSGVAKIDGRVIGFGKIPPDHRQNPVYRNVFGDSYVLQGAQKQGYFEGTDINGDLVRINFDEQFKKKKTGLFDMGFDDVDMVEGWGPRYDTANSHLQKQINGVWYEYKVMEDFNSDLKRLPNHRDLQLWVSTDKNHPGAIIVNKESREIIYRVDKEGLFSFGPLNTDSAETKSKEKYRWLDFKSINENLSFNRFANDAIIWQNVMTKESTLEIPSALLSPKVPLRFIESDVTITDVKGSPRREKRWVLESDPNYVMSSRQVLNGLNNFNNFILIQNLKNPQDVQALILQKSHGFSTFEDDWFSSRKEGSPAPIHRFKVNNEGFLEPKQGAVLENIMVAYQQLTYAAHPADYLRVISYLKETSKTSRYTPDELKALGWIFNQSLTKKDRDPDAYAIRLYAAFLVFDNLSKYPISLEKIDEEAEDDERLISFSSPGRWEEYWNDILEKGFEADGQESLQDVFVNYLQRKNNVQVGLRVQDLITEPELISWGFLEAIRKLESTKRSTPSSPEKIAGTFAPRKTGLMEMKKKSFPEVRTRLGENFIQHFDFVLQHAKSENRLDRNEVKQLLRDSQFDIQIKNSALKGILMAFLLYNEPEAKLNEMKLKFIQNSPREKREEIEAHFQTFLGRVREFCSDDKNYQNVMQDQEKVMRMNQANQDRVKSSRILLESILSSPFYLKYEQLEVLQNKKIDTSAREAMEHAVIRESPRETILPNKLPPIHPIFTYAREGDNNLFASTNLVFDRFFTIPPAVESKAKAIAEPVFQYDVNNNPELKKAVDILNNEISEGGARNQQMKNVELRSGNPKQATDALLANFSNLTTDIKTTQTQMETLKREILDKVNEQFTVDPKKKTQLGGLHKRKLNMDDCLRWLILKDYARIAAETGIHNEAELRIVVSNIVKYLELSVQSIQSEKLNEALVDLKALRTKNGTDADLTEALKNVGNILNEKQDLKNAPNAILILIYEHKMREQNRKIILKPDQIAGLNRMMEGNDVRLNSIFLHRIQAGGKTLIWGQMMAQTKADGYHLSLHVSPTQLYTNNLSDMGYRSKALFGQKVNTLIFDDHPKYFTKDHLTFMKQMLLKAVENREYVNTTNESLRALRDKYIKMNLELHSGKEISNENKAELQATLANMRDILSLLRERGVFTFDEVHLAMDPRKLLNMPYGETSKPNLLHSSLISTMLKTVALAKDNDGNLLCPIRQNLQSQQTEQQKQVMLQKVVDNLLSNPYWMQQLGMVSEENYAEKLEEVKKYILNKDFPLPKEYTENQPATQLLILAHCMIAEGWLTDSLSKNVYEHHGIVRDNKNLPPISGPFNANKTPAKGSEFSDVYVKSTNTFIAYLVEGLNSEQAKDMVDKLQLKAIQELKAQRANNPRFTLNQTATVQQFNAFLEAAGVKNLSLFETNYDNSESIKILLKALGNNNTQSITLLFHYINQNIINKIEIYNEEVSSNGQNTATMASAVNGYSGSLDNPKIAPVMAPTDKQSIECTPEKGVNGQTVDLLINKNREVWIVDAKPESIFSQLFHKLDADKQKKVRAFIDVGCQFRGMENKDVVALVNKELKNDDIKGILYFDNATGDLRFIDRKDPSKGGVISGTDPETIKKVTGYGPEELFTIYSHEKITGTDLLQMPEALAIVSISEGTDLPSLVQGDRRMRGLDRFQGLITSVQSGSLDRIASTLNKPNIKNYKVGEKVPEQQQFIKDVVVYTQVNQVNKQQPDTLTLCCQKLENNIQQALLDLIYAKKLTEAQVFAHVPDLYKRKVGLDLFQEYGQVKEKMPTADYLNKIADSLSKHLDRIPNAEHCLTPQLKAEIRANMGLIIQDHLLEVKSEIQVNPQFKKGPAAGQMGMVNRDAVMVQFRAASVENKAVQQNQAQALQVDVAENQNVNVNVNQNQVSNWSANRNPRRATSPFSIKNYFTSSDAPSLRPINQMIAAQGNDRQLASYANLFRDGRIVVTDNFAKSSESQGIDHIDIVSGYRKPISQIGVIVNRQGQYNFIIGSTEDMMDISKAAKNPRDYAVPEGHKLWVLSPNGELSASSQFDYDKNRMLKDPAFKSGLLQILFLSGHLKELQTPFWSSELSNWIRTLPPEERLQMRTYFENQALFLNPKQRVAYENSPFKNIWEVPAELAAAPQQPQLKASTSRLAPPESPFGRHRRPLETPLRMQVPQEAAAPAPQTTPAADPTDKELLDQAKRLNKRVDNAAGTKYYLPDGRIVDTVQNKIYHPNGRVESMFDI